MRAGQVVRIRVNPKDCMSAVDVLEAAGINTRGMSFSGVISLALSSMLEGLRQKNIIPERDGFEYLKVMEPYLRNTQHMKVSVANTIYGAGDFIVKPVETPAPNPMAGLSTEQRLARSRLSELVAKKEAIADGHQLVWQESDEAEFQQLYFQVYGERP